MREYASLRSGHRDMNGSLAAVAATDPRLLLSSIVHDFNNLLAPIVCILEELQIRRAGTSRQLQKIDGAIYCAFRAKALARQILDFANPRPVRVAEVDVPQLLELLEAALASVLPVGTRLELDVPDYLPPALIDQQLVERALLNLVLNARDAMPDGGDVTIAAGVGLPPANHAETTEPMIRLSVADSGIGMAPLTMELAGRLNFSTKTNGTGLGLATVRQLMESMGGGFSMTSTPCHGTTIDLWLPVVPGRFAD